MLLLDIILEPRRIDTARFIHKPVVRDTVIAPSDTTDTVASTVNVIGGNQQVADIAPHPSGILGMAGKFCAIRFNAVCITTTFGPVLPLRRGEPG